MKVNFWNWFLAGTVVIAATLALFGWGGYELGKLMLQAIVTPAKAPFHPFAGFGVLFAVAALILLFIHNIVDALHATAEWLAKALAR